VVLAAVEQLLSRDPLPAAYRSGWRSAGIEENVDQDDAGLPRSNPGATRAESRPERHVSASAERRAHPATESSPAPAAAKPPTAAAVACDHVFSLPRSR